MRNFKTKTGISIQDHTSSPISTRPKPNYDIQEHGHVFLTLLQIREETSFCVTNKQEMTACMQPTCRDEILKQQTPYGNVMVMFHSAVSSRHADKTGLNSRNIILLDNNSNTCPV